MNFEKGLKSASLPEINKVGIEETLTEAKMAFELPHLIPSFVKDLKESGRYDEVRSSSVIGNFITNTIRSQSFGSRETEALHLVIQEFDIQSNELEMYKADFVQFIEKIFANPHLMNDPRKIEDSIILLVKNFGLKEGDSEYVHIRKIVAKALYEKDSIYPSDSPITRFHYILAEFFNLSSREKMENAIQDYRSLE